MKKQSEALIFSLIFLLGHLLPVAGLSTGPKPKPRGQRRKQSSTSKYQGKKGKNGLNLGRKVGIDLTRTDKKGRISDAIDCEHFADCPGCVVNKGVDKVDKIKSAKLFFSSTFIRKRRLDVHEDNIVNESFDDDFYKVVVPSDLQGWRTQAKLAVAPRSSSWGRGCTLGLYERGTHSVLPIPRCKVHHPSINRAILAIEQATEETNIAAYNEESGDGGLRYVQCQVDRSTGRVSLALVWNAEALKDTQPALARLVKALQRTEPKLWHNIWCHCNDNPGNAIFARNENRWHRMAGLEFVRERLPIGTEGWLYFSPLTFRQGNLDGFDVIARDVAKIVPGGSRVCELYAGIGMLGLTAMVYHAKQGNALKWVRCSDENPANPRCFHRSLRSLQSVGTGLDSRRKKSTNEGNFMTLGEMTRLMESGVSESFESDGKKATYMVASAKDALLRGQALGAEVLIVDPPRKGLQDTVLSELSKPFNPNQEFVEDKDFLSNDGDQVNWTNDVKTLIYVSCGFDALTGDCDHLLRSNAGWMLESATGYVLFPGSDHVETLAVFRRN
mmetsp:Transcript_3958/g.5713  ORF Transcript_3958/g.5713 Transcript_3958/m.5713 type:complete len:557 (-) Transcript_3958:67-1737(-)